MTYLSAIWMQSAAQLSHIQLRVPEPELEGSEPVDRTIGHSAIFHSHISPSGELSSIRSTYKIWSTFILHIQSQNVLCNKK